MKQLLTLLAIYTLGIGTKISATTLPVYKTGDTESSTFGAMLAPGATLVNTETGGFITFDENNVPPLTAPFELSHGARYRGFSLTSSLPSTGNSLVLDFSMIYQINFPYLMSEEAMGYDGDEASFPLDYVIVTFENTNFAEWYSETPMSITAKFSDGKETTAYIISETCDQMDNDTTYGSLIFFNTRIRNTVEDKEQRPSVVSAPEPTTATLSLLALTAMLTQRRRK